MLLFRSPPRLRLDNLYLPLISTETYATQPPGNARTITGLCRSMAHARKLRKLAFSVLYPFSTLGSRFSFANNPVLCDRKKEKLVAQQGRSVLSQMGNCANRSIETALKLLVEQVYTVCKSGNQVASVLSLGIARAFNTVNHLQLLDNLWKRGVPLWFV
jgi:hypothetical protein